MHMRLSPGHLGSSPFFPVHSPTRHRAHFPASRRVRAASGQRARAGRGPLTAEGVWFAVSCLLLALVAVGLALGAVVATAPAASGTADVPWRSSGTAGLLPYAHAQVVAPPPLLPGLAPAPGVDLPYRQW